MFSQRSENPHLDGFQKANLLHIGRSREAQQIAFGLFIVFRHHGNGEGLSLAVNGVHRFAMVELQKLTDFRKRLRFYHRAVCGFNLHNAVAFLQTRLCSRRPGLGSLDDRQSRQGHGAAPGVETDEYRQGQHQVHEYAGSHDDDLLPGRLGIQTFRFRHIFKPVIGIVFVPLQILAAVFFSGHHDIPAKGNGAYGKNRMFSLSGIQRRAHANGKLVTVYPKSPGSQKMPRFMDDHDDRQHENKGKNAR